MTKVSICIPQFNRKDALRLVIEDVLSQTYRDFELIIVDDASTDETYKVVSEFSDSRIRYFRNPENLGLYPNFNKCVELSSGEYVAIYHNHDRYAKTIVEESVKILDNYPNVGFVHTGTSLYFQAKQTINMVRKLPVVSNGHWMATRIIERWDSLIHQPTVMARKKFYELVGSYEDQLYSGSADSAIWLKMCMLGDVGYIRKPLMHVTRRKPTDRYGKFSWEKIEGMINVHYLGCDLIYGGDTNRLKKELIRIRYRHNRYLLLYFLRSLVNENDDVVGEGLEMIEKYGSPVNLLISRKIHKSSNMLKPLLRAAASLYGRIIGIRVRCESIRGHIISYYHQQNN